jgi:hypothetical protein
MRARCGHAIPAVPESESSRRANKRGFPRNAWVISAKYSGQPGAFGTGSQLPSRFRKRSLKGRVVISPRIPVISHCRSRVTRNAARRLPRGLAVR